MHVVGGHKIIMVLGTLYQYGCATAIKPCLFRKCGSLWVDYKDLIDNELLPAPEIFTICLEYTLSAFQSLNQDFNTFSESLKRPCK